LRLARDCGDPDAVRIRTCVSANAISFRRRRNVGAGKSEVMDQATMVASIVAAAIANVSFACAVGACFAVLMLREAPPFARGRLRRFEAGAVAILIVVEIINLPLEAALMSGSAPVAAFAEIVPVLTQSHFGATWISGLVSLIAWTVLLLVGSRGFGWSAQTGLALLAAAAFAFSKAASTHAADAGDFSLPEWVHWLHLCATATWAGLVIASARSVLPMLCANSPRKVLVRFVGRLSRDALVAFSVVVVSGIYNANRGLGGSFLPLAHSGWGVILVTKLLLVGAATILGAVNRLVYLPRMRRGVPGCAAHSFLTILRAEAVTMLAVLTAAAVLAHTAPGTHPGSEL
jgi:copper resistance protein D